MIIWIVYAAAFVVGANIMGFEMLGTRYLFPYFGGGINTWASLISVVLLALMCGYYAGGYLVDRLERQRGLYMPLFAAGAYFIAFPYFADPVLSAIMAAQGASLTATLLGSMLVCFVPLTALGMFTPWSVKLVVRRMDNVGQATGLLYAISTLGNVFGILFTTYVLMPSYGSRPLTQFFGLVAIAVGILFIWLERRRV
ncbi:MAG: fused MFS/spermidine synthase [Hyphomicrobiales bacterium]|nr:fused MFS/spermidine synthase [Hyphomicrobiales bacterium]